MGWLKEKYGPPGNGNQGAGDNLPAETFLETK